MSVGTFKHKRGSPWSAHLSIHEPECPAKRTALGLFWEARRESEQLREGYSEHSGTHRPDPQPPFEKKLTSELSISRKESQESDSRYLFSFHWCRAPFTVIHPRERTHPHAAHYFWEVLKQSWCKTGKNKSDEIYARLDEESELGAGPCGFVIRN